MRGDDEAWVDDDGIIWGRVDVEREITRLNRELDAMTAQLIPRWRDWMTKKRDVRKKMARTGLASRAQPGSGPGGRTTEGEVEDLVAMKHGDEIFEMKLAEGLYKGLEMAIFTKRDQLKSLQSIAANIRADS